MASRFFAGGGSDSESSSEGEEYSLESEESSSSEEESEEHASGEEDGSDDDSSEDETQGAARFLKAGGGASAFVKGAESASESEEERGVIKSARDKRFDELDAIVKEIENKVRNKDWAQVSENFDKAGRLLPNLMKTLDGKVPKLYIKILADLDDEIKTAWEEQKSGTKKMNTLSQKGLNAVRQKVRKLVKEELYIKDVEAYRQDPDEFMEEEIAVETAAPSRRSAPRVELEQAPIDDSGFEVVGSKRSFTPESVLKHLRVIADSRGKKAYDKAEALKTMEKLLEACNTDYLRLRVLLQIVAARLDTSTGAQLTIESWSKAAGEYFTLINTLLEHPNLGVIEDAEEIDDDRKVTDDETIIIPGSPVALAERLSDTLMAILGKPFSPHDRALAISLT